MNFLIAIIIFFISPTLTYASPKRIMVCLGFEEQRIHENKVGGAFYKLNKEMIGAFIQLPSEVKVNYQIYKRICSPQVNFPSLKLLNELINENHDLFYFTSKSGEVSQLAVSKMATNDIIEHSVHIFINFLNSLQSDAMSAKCILNQIPELKKLYEQLRYIEEDVGTKRILKDLKNKDKIFSKLDKASELVKQCSKPTKQQKP